LRIEVVAVYRAPHLVKTSTVPRVDYPDRWCLPDKPLTVQTKEVNVSSPSANMERSRDVT